MSGQQDPLSLIAELDALLGGPAPASGDLALEPPPAAPPIAASVDETTPPPFLWQPEAGHEEEAASSAPPRRILIVDDNKDYREIVKYLLLSTGYQVAEARDGREGLKLAVKDPPDLAILDFDMPGLNGYELIQELRAREETRKIPIMMLTGAQKRRQLRKMGLDISDFLEKPISNEDLLAAVKRVLGAPALPAQASEEAAAPGVPVELAAPAPAAPAPPPLEAFDESIGDDELTIEEHKKEDKEEEEEKAGLDVLSADSPLVNRINRILVRAVEMGASDIHVEPQEKSVLVRVRLNGSLQQLCALPAGLSPQVSARLKIMSNLVITERRRPQDGQVRAMIKGRRIEFRVSTVPSIYGEKIVLRVLGQSNIKAGIDDLGFNQTEYAAVERTLGAPHGLVLVTGPTGSGKTTTLYTMIKVVNTPDVNIMTAEDPIEYELPGITQVHVKPHIGVTFEAVLRSFLRQDPDIMLVGEIRDLETAEISVKASITGHLVFSTLHTNSATATIMRLTHMGVAPYLVADSVKLIIAQRLVKTLCPSCKREAASTDEARRLLTKEELERLGTTFSAVGCPKCTQTGFKGRMAVFEVMPIHTPEMRQLILAQKGVDELAKQALAEGMTTLRQSALQAVAAGKTSLSEAMKIILSD